MTQDEKIKDEIKTILLAALREVDCYVFLFGSRVGKKTHDRSDYDIGILAKKSLDFKLLSRLKGYMEAIPTLIDLVDFKNADPDFKKIALKKIEVWKKPKANFRLA